METETAKRKPDLIFFLLLALSGFGVVLCYDFHFFAAMIFLPALWTAAAFRGKLGAPVFAGLCIFTLVYGLLIGYDFLFSLRILILTAPAAILLYVAHKYRLGNTQATLYLSIAITFGLFAIFCLNAIRLGKPAFSEVRALFLTVLSTLETGMNPSSPVLTTFREYVNNIDIYFPSVLYSFGAFYALVNVLLLRLFNKRKKEMPLVPIRPFPLWRIPRPYVLACVIVMAVSLFISYSGSSKADMILLLSNYMLNMPLSLVGAGMLYGLFTRRKKDALRIILYVVLIVALTLTGLALYTLSIVGFFGCMSIKNRVRKE